ncbi:unnamed protein product [marine sediment metagenome]|uniref:Helix-turn-helix domain-containing protein n=1 Tax=marine sediment metagenome TaxID=412755 RepID=X1P956_9ZZZZ
MIGMTSQKADIRIPRENLLSLPQAAKKLDVHHATVYRWVEAGKLHPIRINSRKYLTVQDVEAMKERREREGIVYTVRRPIRKRGKNG